MLIFGYAESTFLVGLDINRVMRIANKMDGSAVITDITEMGSYLFAIHNDILASLNEHEKTMLEHFFLHFFWDKDEVQHEVKNGLYHVRLEEVKRVLSSFMNKDR